MGALLPEWAFPGSSANQISDFKTDTHETANN
jgi:hypothetical protein